MDFFAILSMAGGLALFLYGMNVMGDSLSKLAGGKLADILGKLTSRRIYAVVLGALVAAIIQSSSATTVMVVGFVNSGIMTLNQAVGIIIGANIGTTVTSWLLSLVGIEGGSFLLNLLKPSSLSPLVALIGILISSFGKNDARKKDIGSILLGFAILMFGMETMSSAVKPLADNPSFTGILTRFSNPLIGVIAGAVLTAVIQSSSASVGILQALCVTGAISFGSAFPIIMGQNIGTCFTAVLSSIGASVNARRASFIHLYFNLIGTLVFMAAFYIFSFVSGIDFSSMIAAPSDIALIHSIFNISCCLLLVPFADMLVKLACLTIKEEKTEEENSQIILDERFLEQPSFALRISKNAIDEMADLTAEISSIASSLLIEPAQEKIKEVERIENLSDDYEDALASYLLKISNKELSKADNNTMSLMLHSITDLERISDHCRNISELVSSLSEKEQSIPQATLNDLIVLGRAVSQIVVNATKAFKENDCGMAIEVEPLEQVIDDLSKTIKQRHIRRLRQGYCSAETGLVIEDLLIDLERISDHCSNIAIGVIETSDDNYDSHSYLQTLSKSDDSTFAMIYDGFSEEYHLDRIEEN